MPNVNDLYPSQWLKASDLGGRPALLTMKEIGSEEMLDGEVKPVLHFTSGKPLVMNRTNANTIAGIYGEATEGWIGKPIVLYPCKVQFQAKMVDAIRVRAPKQGAKLPAPPPARIPDEQEEAPEAPELGEDSVPF